MKAIRLLFVLAIFTGCSSRPPIVVHVYQENKLAIIGEFTKAQEDLILDAVGSLTEDFRASLRTIHVRSDKEHFESIHNNRVVVALGHNCYWEGRKICLRSDKVDHRLVRHEAAHVYTHHNDRSNDFQNGWQREAGDVYDENYEDYYGEMPNSGLLTAYSRRNYFEDIAEWIEHCYNYLYENPQDPVMQNPNFKKDKRYRQKLQLLYQYEFLSEENYKKLKPLFE